MDITLEELAKKVENHIGNYGVVNHGIADESTAGFISGLQTMNRTLIGTTPKDILELKPGHYFGYNWFNTWDVNNTEAKPYTSALAVDVYIDTQENRIVVATEQYLNKIHIYNDYGKDRKSGNVTYWKVISQNKLLWQGNVSAVDSEIPVEELVDKTTGTLMFSKLEINYTYLGNQNTVKIDFQTGFDIAINSTNISNNNSAFNACELFAELNTDKNKYVIRRNNGQNLGIAGGGQLSGTPKESFLSVDANQITIKKITGILE